MTDLHIYNDQGCCPSCGRRAGDRQPPVVPHTGSGCLPYRALVWLVGLVWL
jgi:hypothetical protein